MAKGYVIYNPFAGNGSCETDARILEMLLPDEVQFFDITRITNYSAFIRGMEQDDYLIIMGGDGTLNRFVNDTAGLQIRQQILYYPAGTGNDLARDLGKAAYEIPFPVTQYLQDLPSVEVRGKTYRFLNGVGFGIDGYCCQVGNELKKAPSRKGSFASIAIEGLLFHFNARNALVTVDGREYTYNNVWAAPVMHGRFYCGGMMAAPEQNRLCTDGKLSLMLFHGAGRLSALCVFPSIFKGRHVRHTNMVAVHTGHEIKVEFDRPTPLQIDGETVPHVTCYTARSAKNAADRRKEPISV